MKIKLDTKKIIGIHGGILTASAFDAQMRSAQPEKWMGFDKRLNKLLVLNKRFTEPFWDAIVAMEKQDPQIEKYHSERIELAVKFAQKDEKGRPKTSGNSYIMEDQGAFDDAFRLLKEKFAEALEKEKKDRDLVQEELKKVEEIEVYEIPFDLLPLRFPIAAQEGLDPILNYAEEKKEAKA